MRRAADTVPSKIARTPGFTLIELLVVLLIIGLLAGLVAPRLATIYNSSRLAYEREGILESIASLGSRALLERQGFVIGKKQKMFPFEIPEGWDIETERPIIYKPNGVCLGGSFVLKNETQSYQVTLTPPLCRPTK